jgi:hypothetical protein
MKIKKYNVEEENSSQLGITSQIYNPWYEIMIKKKEFQKKDLVNKNQSLIKTNVKKTPSQLGLTLPTCSQNN